MDFNNIHVYAPTKVAFICGGQTANLGETDQKIKSFRDALIRSYEKTEIRNYDPIKAEELDEYFQSGYYQDILELESDIAQISEIIILFSESFGSAAELGAFSVNQEISNKLLVFIDDKHYNSNSFIKYGPLKQLENAHGQSAVYVLQCADLSITSIEHIANLNIGTFLTRFDSGVKTRVSKYRERTTFDRERSGHVIKLITGLTQHYGALTSDEIETALYAFDLSKHYPNIAKYLMCAKFVKWIKPEKVGSEPYFCSIVDKPACRLPLLPQWKHLDRDRWRADIREHWRVHDPERFAAIQSAVGRR